MITFFFNNPFVLALLMMFAICASLFIIYVLLALIAYVECRIALHRRRRASRLNARDAICEAEMVLRASRTKKVEE